MVREIEIRDRKINELEEENYRLKSEARDLKLNIINLENTLYEKETFIASNVMDEWEAKEPRIHSHITDVLSKNHPLCIYDVSIDCVECGDTLHCGTANECMQLWIETGMGNFCAKCFAKKYDEDKSWDSSPFALPMNAEGKANFEKNIKRYCSWFNSLEEAHAWKRMNTKLKLK